MKTIGILVISLLAICLLASCSTAQTEYNETVDFSTLHSFIWQKPPHEKPADPVLDNPLFVQLVSRAVIANLLEAGYKKIDSQHADFIVTINAERKENDVSDAVDPPMGMGLGGNGQAAPFNPANVATGGIKGQTLGVLTIFITNPQTGDVIWRGWRKKPLTRINFSRDGIAKTVSQILADFPPERKW